MSIRMMNMVFERYPVGGNEGMLALALADHAHDDGTRIWPSLDSLARKTKQHRSSVQRQITKMVERGWLQLVRKASGRPGDTNEYRVNPAWIAGAELSTGSNLLPVSDPIDAPEPVDNVIHTGSNLDERGRKSDERGSTAVLPESSGTIKNQYPLTPVGTGDCGKPKARTARDAKAPWRWRESFEGYRKRGEQLGVPYRAEELGTAWTDDQRLAHERTYRDRVEAAHQAGGGGP